MWNFSSEVSPPILAPHKKDPLASVTTVLNRVVRVWRGPQPEQRPGPARVGVDQRNRAAGGRDAFQENGLITSRLYPAAWELKGG